LYAPPRAVQGSIQRCHSLYTKGILDAGTIRRLGVVGGAMWVLWCWWCCCMDQRCEYETEHGERAIGGNVPLLSTPTANIPDQEGWKDCWRKEIPERMTNHLRLSFRPA
jgi:hypothetical protein